MMKMDKQQLMEILQTSILWFEGKPEQELNQIMNPENVKVGIKMTKFLQEKVE